MGIDIYMRWNGQTKQEREAQFKGFDTTIGDAGYLREAYHGGPYATEVLVKECFEGESCTQRIPAATLRARLPETIETVKIRAKKVYDKTLDDSSPQVKSFEAFVSLAEKKESELGEPVEIHASY